MNIIGIAGPAGCGKDTAAQALVDDLGFQRMQFSAPLKRGIAAMFQWNLEDLQGADREWRENVVNFNGHELPSPRHMMQTLGTEWGRELINQDLWVRLAENDVIQSDNSRFVFTDLRFENEAKWIRSCGGAVIHLSRPEQVAIATAGHASEAGLTHYPGDYEITNHSTIEHLHDAMISIACVAFSIE